MKNKYKILISIFIVCIMVLSVTACTKTQTNVLNTKSALYVQNAFKAEPETQETQMKGRVIKLGSSTNSGSFGPSFEFSKLRTN